MNGRARLLVASVLALVLVPGLAACGAQGTGDKGYVQGDGVVTEVAVQHRHQVGTVSGDTLDGGHFDLADHRGKVVVVNVWGSWCVDCRAEARALAAAARELNGKGVVFVGIDNRDPSKAAPLAYNRRFGIGYPSIYDPSGDTLLAFRGTIPPNAIPSTLVIDAQGRIAARVLGEVPSTTTLVDIVQDVRGGSAGGADTSS